MNGTELLLSDMDRMRIKPQEGIEVEPLTADRERGKSQLRSATSSAVVSQGQQMVESRKTVPLP